MPIPTPESVKLGRTRRRPMAKVMKTAKRKSKAANKPSVTQEPAIAAQAPAEEVVAAAKAAAPAPVAKPTPLFALASHCTVKDAASLKVQLLSVAEIDADLTIDVSAVERIDTSTMQLLCALVHDRALRIQRVVFKGESQSWREAVRLLGVAQCLGYKEGARA